MDLDFWHERWQNNETGFHQETINPYMQRNWSRLQLPPAAAVLVPCCGKSKDLLWLREQGCMVQGVEISPLAVDAFFSENDLQPEITEQGDYRIATIAGLQLYCGDFFKLTAADVKGISAVFDRAAMIAMPAEMRQSYCRHLQTITNKQVPILLVTLEYPEGEMQGPPFSVTEEEINDCYAENYTVLVLETEDILADNDFFKERGLTRLQERVYLLTPH
jgi:thiopurine S-methyltransferase